MASPISYEYPKGPPGQDTFTAEDDVARLVETLHRTGTLRTLNGLADRLEEVMTVVLGGIDTQEGRNAVANGLLLVRLLGRLEADGVDRFATGLERGLRAAGERVAARDEAPGALTVLKQLRDPAVLRGLDAVLTFLGTLGAQLHAPHPPIHSNADGVGDARP